MEKLVPVEDETNIDADAWFLSLETDYAKKAGEQYFFVNQWFIKKSLTLITLSSPLRTIASGDHLSPLIKPYS